MHVDSNPLSVTPLRDERCLIATVRWNTGLIPALEQYVLGSLLRYTIHKMLRTSRKVVTTIVKVFCMIRSKENLTPCGD